MLVAADVGAEPLTAQEQAEVDRMLAGLAPDDGPGRGLDGVDLDQVPPVDPWRDGDAQLEQTRPMPVLPTSSGDRPLPRALSPDDLPADQASGSDVDGGLSKVWACPEGCGYHIADGPVPDGEPHTWELIAEHMQEHDLEHAHSVELLEPVPVMPAAAVVDAGSSSGPVQDVPAVLPAQVTTRKERSLMSGVSVSSGRAWAWASLVLGGGVSIAGNVGHLYVRPDGLGPAGGWAIAGAVVWPVLLFFVVKVMSLIPWPPGAKSVLWRVLGALPVAAVAAYVSWDHISGLLRLLAEGDIVCYAGPFAIDGLMVVAMGALLVTSSQPQPTTRPATQPAPAAPGALVNGHGGVLARVGR